MISLSSLVDGACAAGDRSLGVAPSKPGASNLVSRLNLPADFLERVRHRAVMDAYAAAYHGVEGQPGFAPVRLAPRNRQSERGLRVVRPQLSDPVLRYRLALDQPVVPLRGFRAPILEEADDLRPVVLPEKGLTAVQSQAAEWIRDSLASEGLPATLARVLEILGARGFATNSPGRLRELRDLGFPVDWLRFFPALADGSADEARVVAAVAELLAEGRSAGALKLRLRATPFVFRRTHPGFRAAEETGEHEIGLIRLQIGGGYQGGIVPGSSLHVTGQLLEALPSVSFLASVPADQVGFIRELALKSWALRRADCLTLIAEPARVSGWAQDNGKAGFLAGGNRGAGVPATLAPRYASEDEAVTAFVPGESFLMDGLRAADHVVVHSPLLFQGGNLLVVGDPRRRERLLLLSETEVYRNMALGLTRDQALTAFQAEFDVDRCVVLPAVSYHLDYDVTVRVHEGRVVAFVNDPQAAARLIVHRSINALEAGGAMSAVAAAGAREELARTNLPAVFRQLGLVTRRFRTGNGRYRAELAARFVAQPTDLPVLNLQCCLSAQDVLASQGLVGTNAPAEAVTVAYFEALRALEATARAQHEQLRSLGWKVVPVPSMPDLFRSVNYLNGVQDRTRFLMPVLGGFYAALDEAAARAFQNELGPGVRIVQVLTAGTQQEHGALHCLAAAYPRLNAGDNAEERSTRPRVP